MKLKILIAILGCLIQQAHASLYTVGATLSGPNTDLGWYTWSIDNHVQSGLAGAIRLDPVNGGKSFETLCTDVSAVLVLGNSYTFSDPKNFAQTALGSNPYWGADHNSALQAINNAAFLYYNHQDWLYGNDLDKKAALQLAVWAALYNTGGKLTLDDQSQRFWVAGQSEAKTEADALLATLLTANLSTLNGQLLQPLLQNGGVDIGAQEVFAPPWMLGDSVDPITPIAPVPEPSTVVAGLLLMIPLGVSIARRLHRKTH